jgi:cytochrome c-type biogenesis protein CcmH/NrfG
MEVLAGNQGQFPLAVRRLEQAATAAPGNEHNLFTLGRAYFYDAITHNNLASAEKAERAFSRVLELNPRHDARAFHGSVLTILSQGKDLEKFHKGIQEMNQVVQQDPSSLNGRLS